MEKGAFRRDTEAETTKAGVRKDEVNSSFSSVNLQESPKKCNLSFSFNFDFDDVNSDNSTDSETADLQIDVSEVDNYDPSSKHKRETADEASVLNEMEEEIERQLDAKAAKTNLTATNVKNILKHVITNEHVMAMVKKRLHDTDEDIVFEPKLTRAKAKELAATQGNIPWPITPIKKASSEVQVLIEEELPEDSSDEEYNPEQDKQSDDDREPENLNNSDVDSQPSTPANPYDSASTDQSKTDDVQYDPDGIFKIPGIPHVPTEEESIGQRTRSKLCLSETPLEQIEQAFIPPDITTDMYDWDCEVDEDWDNFLKEFTQPLKQDPAIEDDPDTDPEYNILEDEETDLLDKEELRADKAVKVTRKELNNLIAELFEFTDTFSKNEQEVSKKKKSSDSSNALVENHSVNCSMVDLLPVLAEPELPKLVNHEQWQLLGAQFRQHVQLVAQHFLMAYMHPQWHSHSKTCQDNLNSLKYLSNGPSSVFNADNLPYALQLIADWENKFRDPKFAAKYKKDIENRETEKQTSYFYKWKHTPKFHPELEKIIVKSRALMYPQLLPEMPFQYQTKKSVKTTYLKSEETLIALGLEQFLPFVASKQRKFKSKMVQLVDAIQLINQYLLPCKKPLGLLAHIQKRRYAKDVNPIKHYFYTKSAPRMVHYIKLESSPKAPQDRPLHHLPLYWQIYLQNTQGKVVPLKSKDALSTCNDLLEKGNTVGMTRNVCSVISNNHPLRNPIVNILPKISPPNMYKKNITTSLTSNSPQESFDVLVGTSIKDSDSGNGSQTSDDTQDTANISITDTRTENIRDVAINDSRYADANVALTKNSKVSRKSAETLSQLPQLRETTPRLAKIKSAQNMKLMTQASTPKTLSNCNTIKARTKNDAEKDSETSNTLSKVDNEEEIAELMLASTTIKKDSISRKKAKQARELENIKRLLESENPLHEEQREAKFAASYLQKLHFTLESRNPEIFRAVIKCYLDYKEKMDSINRIETESCFSTESESIQMKDTDKNLAPKDLLAIDLYKSVCDKLQNYPELCTDFLLFLKPHQAAMIDKSLEYMMLQKMKEFINVAQVYFAKQPSRLAKIMQAITQLSSDPYVTLENVHAIMGPILKGHPLVLDLFLQVLPTGKPPESLFASHMFESLTCPLGPQDKSKVYTEDSSELYENVELPVLAPQEDPYGGENCKCDCHNGDAGNLKNNTEHCVSCGTRFLNGRIYLQTSEGLRPAKITFPGADQEKQENIARVSLKAIDKFIPPVPSRQRRKSSKSDASHEEQCHKPCPSKGSPSKESEESEKVLPKSRRGAKSPPKSGDQKKSLKRLPTAECISSSCKKIRTTDCKNKRERRVERREESMQISDIGSSRQASQESAVLHIKANSKDVAPSNENSSSSKNNNEDKAKVRDDVECDVSSESNRVNTTPWTRQEDMILLQSIKKEYSENSFIMVSKQLGNRTVEQVKGRCQTLLSLLEKMT